MNYLPTLVALIIVLAIFQLALKSLLVALLLGVVTAIVVRPRETVIFTVALTIFSLARARPIECIVAIAMLGIMALMIGARRNPQKAKLLAEQTKRR